MKKTALLIINLLILQVNVSNALPTAKITVKAVDEEGLPLEGARISMAFTIPKPDDIGTADLFVKGITDSAGQYSAENISIGTLGFSIDHEGYYQSNVGYEFTSYSKLRNRWEPWNPTVEVVLKKKRNPVPMYVKGGTSTTIPVFGQPVGYDLEKGDWISPYGKGIISDFVFVCKFNRVDFDNAETSCEISFSNEKDGIQEFIFIENDPSYYKWPFEAPIDNYKNKLYKWMSVHFPEEGYKSNIDDRINYIFRVRSKTDKKGNIISANYGKIKKDFLVSRKGKIKFFYYFNPDGTRNLEEDPERNLFNMK